MNDRIRNLLEQIRRLEEELKSALAKQESIVRYRIEGKRVQFEQAVKEAHQRLKVGLFHWLRQSRPQSIISAPFIYCMIVPLVLLDISISLYQAVCFRLYGIPRVRRLWYLVNDRHQLAYLNSIEKVNCSYCGYATGVIAYTQEIISRTEQYWCPIKHAHKVVGTHARYEYFLEYGQAEDYPARLAEYRAQVTRKPEFSPVLNEPT